MATETPRPFNGALGLGRKGCLDLLSSITTSTGFTGTTVAIRCWNALEGWPSRVLMSTTAAGNEGVGEVLRTRLWTTFMGFKE